MMQTDNRQQYRQDLKSLSQALFQTLQADEHLTLSYSGEESLFIRINNTTIRQISEITQGYLTLNFISGRRQTECTFTLTGDLDQDIKQAFLRLDECRTTCHGLPEDPYV